MEPTLGGSTRRVVPRTFRRAVRHRAGSGLASLNATVANIALPRIGRDLYASLSGL
jgi:hypothetical protein